MTRLLPLHSRPDQLEIFSRRDHCDNDFLSCDDCDNDFLLCNICDNGFILCGNFDNDCDCENDLLTNFDLTSLSSVSSSVCLMASLRETSALPKRQT